MKSKRILIVEDEVIVAMDIEKRLSNLGYEVIGTFPTGEEAIIKSAQLNPDLILMDIKLQGQIDGIATAERIRQTQDLPIIYLTAFSDEKTVERAKTTEAFGYLLKPFQDKELRTTIEMAFYKHQMEKRLRENEQWLNTILKSLGEGIIATNNTGLITFMNPVAEKLTGWESEAACGKKLEEVYGTLNEPAAHHSYKASTGILEEKLSIHRLILIRKDGTRIPIEETLSQIQEPKGTINGLVFIFRDISEQRQIEEERDKMIKLIISYSDDRLLIYHKKLRSMAFHIALSREHQLHQIAVTLEGHIKTIADSAETAGFFLKSQVIGETPSVPDKTAPQIQADIEALKQLAFEICPKIIYEKGFEPALNWYIDFIKANFPINIEAKIDPNPIELREDIQILFFKILRILMDNILHHSRAKQIELTLRKTPEAMMITVKDDGSGFDISKIDTSQGQFNGFGVFSIRELLDYLGGSLEIKSEKENRTVVALTLPLNEITCVK